VFNEYHASKQLFLCLIKLYYPRSDFKPISPPDFQGVNNISSDWNIAFRQIEVVASRLHALLKETANTMRWHTSE
jgi:hypothetical protein